MIYLNGELIHEEDTAIAINDRGFLLGDGLFETIRFDNGVAFRFEQHWSRLIKGCGILGIGLPLDLKIAEQHAQTLLTNNQLDKQAASLRITITRGCGPRGLAPPHPATPTVMMQCFDIPAKKATSLSVMHSDIIINEHSPCRQFKSLNYTDNIIARQHAINAGHDDALLYNTQDELVSATCANIFYVINDVLITPPLEAGALPGIMRQHILETAQSLGITTQEKILRHKDATDIQEAFLSNSIIQITPIKRIESQTLISAGRITQQLYTTISKISAVSKNLS